MDDNYVEISINGVTYYIEASRLKDLNFIDNKLVNTSNSTITMVNNFDYNNTTYPRITCSSMQQCVIRESSLAVQRGITDNYILVSKYNMNILQTNGLLSLIFLVLFTILGVRLIWKH